MNLAQERRTERNLQTSHTKTLGRRRKENWQNKEKKSEQRKECFFIFVFSFLQFFFLFFIFPNFAYNLLTQIRS